MPNNTGWAALSGLLQGLGGFPEGLMAGEKAALVRKTLEDRAQERAATLKFQRDQLSALERHQRAQEGATFVEHPALGRVHKAMLPFLLPQAEKPTPFTLGEGQQRFDPLGKLLAAGPPKVQDAPRSATVDVQRNRLIAEGVHRPNTPGFDIELGKRMERMIPIPWGAEVQTPSSLLAPGGPPKPLYERALSPEQAGELGVPSGTLPSEAKGRLPLTAAQRTKTDAQSAVLGMVDQMEQSMARFQHPKTPLERVTKLPKRAFEVYGQADPALTAAHRQIEGTLALIVRSLGEVGTLTDKDIERARALQPTLVPIPDTEAVIREKLNGLRQLVREVVSRTGSRPETLTTPRSTTRQVRVRDKRTNRTGTATLRAGETLPSHLEVIP